MNTGIDIVYWFIVPRVCDSLDDGKEQEGQGEAHRAFAAHSEQHRGVAAQRVVVVEKRGSM